MLLGKRGVWIVLAVSAAIFSIAPSLTHSLGWLVTCKEEKRGRGIGKEKKKENEYEAVSDGFCCCYCKKHFVQIIILRL